MKVKRTNNRKKRGAALVEYGLLVAGVALTTAVAVTMLGHKTTDLLGTVAGALPSSNTNDAKAIQSGRLFNTTLDATTGAIIVDYTQDPLNPNTTDRVFGEGAGDLIYDPQQP